MANLTLLCTGDLHLGRHPTRIPPDVDGQELSPRAVWRATVQEALDRAVDAVVVTGDVVDRENRYFEAYGAFEEGAARLAEADVPLVTVAGNHDFDVLPRVVRELDLDTVRLLGADGEWGRWTLERDGEQLLHVDGWSFPSEHVLNSPLDDYDPSPDGETPLLGVLHADLDSQGSRYAPVRTSQLHGTPADAWLLGHVHRPKLHSETDPAVLYPGSPQALDPGERGAHGPWVVTLDGTGRVETEHVPLASVRYDRLEVDVSRAADPKAVPSLVSDRIERHVRTEVTTGPLELLLARVRLTGRTEAHAALVDERRAIEEQLAPGDSSLPVHVETVSVDTRPEVDLAERAGGDGPVAYLADLLLALEDGTPRDEHARLVDDALDALQEAHTAPAYATLRRDGRLSPPDEDDALAALESQARLLLDRLLDQTEDEQL